MPLSVNGKAARQDQAYYLYTVIAAGLVLRLLLFRNDALVLHASRRLELATPLTSWQSCEFPTALFQNHDWQTNESGTYVYMCTVQEGVYLWKRGLDPYDGAVFRQVRNIYIRVYLYADGLTMPDCIDHTSPSACMVSKAAILLPIFAAIPSTLIPLVYTSADITTSLSIVGIAKIRSAKQQYDQPALEPYWVALMWVYDYHFHMWKGAQV